MLVKGIHWLGVCAADWEASTAFYRDVLGLSVRGEGVQSSPSDAGARFMELAAANGDFVEVFGDGLADRELFGSPMIGFLVDDVVAARAEMERKGAAFIGPVGRGGRWEWSYFRTPEGHVHQLLAEIDRSR
jgi:catechol 2,3-dioxygenase-like lactoylglutathione lyase family enzyme